MEEKNEGRVNIEELPQGDQELTPDEAKEVQRETDPRVIYLGTGEADNDGKAKIITAAGPGGGPQLKN